MDNQAEPVAKRHCSAIRASESNMNHRNTISKSLQTSIKTLNSSLKVEIRVSKLNSRISDLVEVRISDEAIERGEHINDNSKSHLENLILSTPTKSKVTVQRTVNRNTTPCGPFPPTPDPTPTRSLKHSADSTPPKSSIPRKPRLQASPPTNSPIHYASIPHFSIVRPPSPDKFPHVSADELKRISEAVLQQVDWIKVQSYVASNRDPSVYRKIFKSVLQACVSDLAEMEEAS